MTRRAISALALALAALVACVTVEETNRKRLRSEEHTSELQSH